MANVSRRNFLRASAAAAGIAGVAGIAGCDGNSGAAASDPLAAPAADKYPIEPDKEGAEAKWASEEVRDGWTRYTNEGGVEVGVMDTAKIIQVDGFAFKDLNGNGKLDLYEDWRQDGETRAKALAEMMSADEIAPLLFHGGAAPSSQLSSEWSPSGYGYVEQGSCAGVSRLKSSLKSCASDVRWINEVQETAEKGSYGIPYINSTDPYQLFGIPHYDALAACMDKDVWRKAGMWFGRGWRASGVRCELGPQVDVYSQIRGTRLSGSVSCDPAVNRDFAAAFGGGMQSTWGDDEATDDQGWGKDSVGVMLKHYAGEGCSEGGRDDHSDMGKWNVFPGGNFNAHLVPFLDGGLHLDSKTEQMAAVMPCYGIAYDPNEPDGLGEHVGSAYSKHNMSILRNTGWDGMVTTDWMILDEIAHGVRDITEAERFKKLIDCTIDQHGGTFEPEVAKEAYQLLVSEVGEEKALASYRDAARRIFAFMYKVDLFDQPYTALAEAKAMFENENAVAFGKEAAAKSVVMLKNAGDVIAKAGLSGKVYIPQRVSDGAVGLSFGAELDLDFDYVTDTVGEPSVAATEEGGEATYQESDVTRLTAAELADVKYAIIGVTNPDDAYQGVEGGLSFKDRMKGATEAEKPAVYRPMTLQYRPYTADGPNVRKESLNPADEFGNKENRSYYGQSSYATNEADLDLVLDVKSKLPADAKIILVVTVDRPMCFGEIEPSCDAILLAFTDSHGAFPEIGYQQVLTGAVEPSGLLPHPMPKDMDAVEAAQEDVPRAVDCYVDAAGNTYDFCFGLNWSGVIDDERTKTYKAAPLTGPEACEVKADA